MRSPNQSGSPLIENKILLLYWKTLLFLFGSSKELQESKAALREQSDVDRQERSEGFITASPLDYHLFRQEITSKYPAYNPPPPLVPIEEENNSILPPLPNHSSRRASQESLNITTGPSTNNILGSIFNQPVHIATPAPSPPPSPAGPGGKGGKKQNYQTNQNFPFLYPPLDESSNVVGGKGKAELQDQFIRKRWEGGDVPASIVEAGQLFASRMRMTRSIRQLWDVRERFIRHERGWNEASRDADRMPDKSDIQEELSNDETVESSNSDMEAVKETDNVEVQRRLDAIEKFYVGESSFVPTLSAHVFLARLSTLSPICCSRSLEDHLWQCVSPGVSSKWSKRNGFPGGQSRECSGEAKIERQLGTEWRC